LQNDRYVRKIKKIMSFKENDYEILMYFDFYILLFLYIVSRFYISLQIMSSAVDVQVTSQKYFSKSKAFLRLDEVMERECYIIAQLHVMY